MASSKAGYKQNLFVDGYIRMCAEGKISTFADYLKKAFPMITTWTWEAGMSTVGTGSTAAALIYRKDPSKMRAVQPMTLQALAPEADGLTFKVTLESRFGGVMAPKPRSVERLEGI